MRRRSAALSRPVITPMRNPAVRPRVIPCPSCASKVLISIAEPSGCESNVTLPSVIVPSTSISTTFIFAARFFKAGEVLGVQATFPSRDIVYSGSCGGRLRHHFHRRAFRSSGFCGGGRQAPSVLLLFVNYSDQLQSPQIVQVHHSQDFSIVIHDNHTSNPALLQQCQSLARQHSWTNCLWIACHTVRKIHIHHRAAVLFHQTPQIAVSQNSRQLAVGVHHGGHTQLFCGHFVEHPRHGRIQRNARQLVSRVHHFLHSEQALA